MLIFLKLCPLCAVTKASQINGGHDKKRKSRTRDLCSYDLSVSIIALVINVRQANRWSKSNKLFEQHQCNKLMVPSSRDAMPVFITGAFEPQSTYTQTHSRHSIRFGIHITSSHTCASVREYDAFVIAHHFVFALFSSFNIVRHQMQHTSMCAHVRMFGERKDADTIIRIEHNNGLLWYSVAHWTRKPACHCAIVNKITEETNMEPIIYL